MLMKTLINASKNEKIHMKIIDNIKRSNQCDSLK